MRKPWLVTIGVISVVSVLTACLPLTIQTADLTGESLILIRFLKSPYPFYLPCAQGTTARSALSRIGVIEIEAIYRHVGSQKIAWDWNAPVTVSATFTIKQK